MYKIYTDGGCRGNPGIGAWGMAVYEGFQHKGNKSGFKEVTTNNEMELQAVVEAVQWAIRAKLPALEIYSDSAYVCNGFNSWMEGWKARMWKTSGGGTVKNLELWRSLYHDSKLLDVKVIKVKAHCGIEGNELADTLCNCAMDEWELQHKVMK